MEDVVGLYRRFGVRLPALGDGWVTARCFTGRHQDRHPSARVHLRSGGFRCFTCGEAGGVLDALQLLGVYDRDEARRIAIDYGILELRPPPRARARPRPRGAAPPAPRPPPLPPPTPPPPVPLPLPMASGERIDWDALPAGPAVVHDRTWTYTDALGEAIGRVRRLDLEGGEKRIWQERPENGRWVSGLGGAHLPLYQLPAVLSHAAAGRRVLVVEGEKAVDALARIGFFATTNAGGAGKWRPEHTRALRGASVIVVCDSDGPGRLHALEVTRSLLDAGGHVQLPLDPAPLRRDGYDVVDMLAAVAANVRAYTPKVASATLRRSLYDYLRRMILEQLPADLQELQRWHEHAEFLTNPDGRIQLECDRCGLTRVHRLTHGIAYCGCGAHRVAPAE